jgi:hypothetical protein
VNGRRLEQGYAIVPDCDWLGKRGVCCMKAGPVEIGTLLQNRNRYCVPIYQRHYVWEKSKQWEPFWQDIRTKAVERLAGRERRFSHFMGAVVLESRAKPSVKQVPSFQVVDGQQRLTTFLLFLTAARHYAQSIGHESSAANIQRYILNSDPHLMETPEIEIFKVWPTQADRVLFLDVVSSENRDAIRAKYSDYWYKKRDRDQIQEYSNVPKVLGAYGYFYDRIRHSVQTTDLHADITDIDEDSVEDEFPKELKLDAIWQSLLEEFKVVEIVLDEGDDAQVIFETLNDRGEPLLAADLVRNNIFQRADARNERAEELFAKYWKSFEDPFWFELEKQGRYKKQRVEFFLANFIAGMIAGEVGISKLFSEYKAFLRPPKGGTAPRYATVAEEIQNLETYGRIYRELIERSPTSPFGGFSKRLQLWDVTTANPLILRLWAHNDIPQEDKISALNFLLALIVRRAVCELTTKNYNNLFLSCISGLDRDGWSLGSLYSHFLGQTAESARFPSNDEFTNALVNKPVYKTLGPTKTRALLIELERAKYGKLQEVAGIRDDLTVEHIMPSSWYRHWPMMDGVIPTDGDELTELMTFHEDDTLAGRMVRRRRILNSVGNLTLVTPSFNSKVSNKAFLEKRPEFKNQCVLMLTKDFVEKVDWNETTIETRGKSLAALALVVWPRPGS